MQPQLSEVFLNTFKVVGGGGGQPFYATAGGKNPAGIDAAIEEALKMI